MCFVQEIFFDIVLLGIIDLGLLIPRMIRGKEQFRFEGMVGQIQ